MAPLQSTLKKLLSEKITDNNVYYTHVSMVTPRAKYQFDRKGMETMWKLWCDLLSQEDDLPFGLAERPQDYLPVLVDIDLKMREPDEEIQSLYTEEQVRMVIEAYQSVLRNMVEDCSDENLLCVLLEKPLYREQKGSITYLKNGFHLHFPGVFLSRADQQVYILPEVMRIINELDVFEGKKAEEVVDDCTKKNWLIYGAKKEGTNMKAYKVTRIFNASCEELTLQKAFQNYAIYDSNEKRIPLTKKYKYYLPRILSIRPNGRDTHNIRPGVQSFIKHRLPKIEPNKVYNNNLTVVEALRQAKTLVGMLSDDRAIGHDDWMNIGWALYNIGDGCQEALDLWCEFSARHPEEHDESRCIYEWERMVKRNKTLGSLKFYAKNDNPEAYKAFVDRMAKEHVNETLAGNHNDIAQLLYKKYGDEFVCASIRDREWYQFKHHRWHQIEEGIYLREKISGPIVQLYVDKYKDILELHARTEDDGEKAMYNVRMKQYNRMINNLKNATFKNSVMREAAEVFYDERFNKKLDKDPYLIAFQNGVYDLKSNTFRDGSPDDFIAKAMPIEYHEYSEDDDEVQEVHDFLDKVFPDRTIRKYFLDVSSSMFEGGNMDKKVYFWIGEGDNAKSVTQSLFETMFGDYSIKIPTTVLTSKKPPTGAAIPELARAGNGVRHAVLEEPDEGEKCNIGILKHLSGNDTFFVRGLYKSGGEIKPMFKLIFICNVAPSINGDTATWNRIRVIPFESTFCHDAPETYEEQLRQKKFPMDPQFGKKIPGMAPALAWVLLNHRKTVTTIIEPEKVKIATASYRRRNDIFRQFIEECVMEDKEKALSLTELYASFKNWFRESLPNHSIPIKNDIKDYFIRLWGDFESGCKWLGYKIRSLEDEIEAGDAVVINEDDLVEYNEQVPL